MLFMMTKYWKQLKWPQNRDVVKLIMVTAYDGISNSNFKNMVLRLLLLITWKVLMKV